MATPFPDIGICNKDPEPERILHRPRQALDMVDVKEGADDETWLCFNSDGKSRESWKT